MTRVLIIGAGGHAQVIADAILSVARSGGGLTLGGFVDDNAALHGQQLLGFPVLGASEQVDLIEHDAIVVGIGDNGTRARLFERFTRQRKQFVSVIHPRAIVAADVQLGAGCVVFAGAVINTGSIIGTNVIVNTGATIDHHARIGQHVHIAPGVHLGGAVTVGDGAFIGIGSSVIPNHSIGVWATVGAGSTVIHDLPGRIIAVGTPARIIKTLPETD